MNATHTHTEIRPAAAATDVRIPQHTKSQITKVWAAAAAPMAAAAWVATPILARVFDGPTAFPRALILTLTVAVVWQFFLVMALVRREQGTLRRRARRTGAAAAGCGC